MWQGSLISKWSILVATVLSGCSNAGDSPKESTQTAMISTTAAGTSFAYADPAANDRLSEVLSGANPKDFHWVMVTVPAAHAADLSTGLTADLTKTDSGIEFKQVYQGVCNPALRDFGQCWLFESYKTGEAGLSGVIQLRIANGFADGSIELSWEGDTDRFGDPIQHHQHGTSAGIHIPVVEYVEQGGAQ